MTNTPPFPSYAYNAELVRVIDGDTIEVLLDLGCYVTIRKKLRFMDVDTHELRDRNPDNRFLAQEAKRLVQHAIVDAEQLIVQTKMDAQGKYGRLLAWVWIVEHTGEMYCLNTRLVELGHDKHRLPSGDLRGDIDKQMGLLGENTQ